MGDGDFTIINIREFNYNLAAFQGENGLWGFMDREGKIVINPIFKSVSDFTEQGYAKGIKEGTNEEIIINKYGEDIVNKAQIIKRKYNFLEWIPYGGDSDKYSSYIASIVVNGPFGKRYYLVHNNGDLTITRRNYPDVKKTFESMYKLDTIVYAEVEPFINSDHILFDVIPEFDDSVYEGRNNTFVITKRHNNYSTCWFQMINKFSGIIEFKNEKHSFYYSDDIKIKRLNKYIVSICDPRLTSVDIYFSDGEHLIFENSVSVELLGNVLCIKNVYDEYSFYNLKGEGLLFGITSYEYTDNELIVYYMEDDVFVSSYIPSFIDSQCYTQKSKDGFVKLYPSYSENNYEYKNFKSGLKSTKDICYSTNNPYEYDRFTLMFPNSEISFPNSEVDEIFTSVENYSADGFIIGKVSDRYHIIVKIDKKTHKITKRIDVDCENINYQNGYFIIRKDDRYGLLDEDGNEILPCDNFLIKFLDKKTIFVSSTNRYIMLHLDDREFSDINLGCFNNGIHGNSIDNMIYELSSPRDRMLISFESNEKENNITMPIENFYLTNKNNKITIPYEVLFEKQDDHLIIRRELIPFLPYFDLSIFTFKNVDITGISFVNTNAIIDPRVVYKGKISDCEFEKENLLNVTNNNSLDYYDSTRFELVNEDGTIKHILRFK